MRTSFGCRNAQPEKSHSFAEATPQRPVAASDADDRFPHMLSTNAGGVMELINTGPGGMADPRQTYWEFVCMSNELATPKLVVCPRDDLRTSGSNFIGMAYGRLMSNGAQNGGVSYFVSLCNKDPEPMSILVGDRNISTMGKVEPASAYDAFLTLNAGWDLVRAKTTAFTQSSSFTARCTMPPMRGRDARIRSHARYQEMSPWLTAART